MQPPQAGTMEAAFHLLHENDDLSREKAYAILRRKILRWGIRFSGGNRGADAEDNTQDVVASTLSHLSKLPDAQALSAYLYRAARNRYLDSLRSTAGRRIAVPHDRRGSSDLNLQFVADRTESPEDRVARLQQGNIVHRAMLTLPPRYRIVLLLHDVEDLDTCQVARILALDPGTVRVQLHRARLLLRRRLNAIFCYRRPVNT
ncbi:MAG: RNA polymerase sigma factor [Acidobacteriota bacterium]